MKSTWFSKRQHYEFARLLRDTSHDGFHNIFGDFLQCAAASLIQPIFKMATGEIDPKIEEDYLRTIQKNSKYAAAFPKALGQLVFGLEEEPHDFLGDVSASLGLNDKNYRGQCFTPYSLCQAMAEMTIGDQTPDDFENRQMLLNEPACGGGAMLIAVAAKLAKNGFFPWNYYFIAQDVDIKCFHMTYIQATLMGIPATVIWGNTLSLEEWERRTTFAGAMHPMKKRLDKESVTKAVRIRVRKQKAVRIRTRK